MSAPMLFQPLRIRDVAFRNRVMISPMCTYSAEDGLTSDWHLAHLGKFALGGAGGIMTEAAAVSPEGRITHGDLGIWSDIHSDALQRIVTFCKGAGAAFGVQLGHAGRKASMQRPWFGNAALTAEDHARGDLPWEVVGPSALPLDDGWLIPSELTEAGILKVAEDFAAAARRADHIGCDFVEVHGAHGYLLQSFLSPISNQRGDEYGGDLSGRMKAPLLVAKAVREAWPTTKPLFFRISSVDGIEGGWQMADSVALAHELKALGFDVIDCSSLGNTAQGATAAPGKRGVGFQTPFSARIRQDVGIMTQAVGLLLDGPTAEEVLQSGRADIVAIGREALLDPFWPLHEARKMGIEAFDDWPVQYGWWLTRREGALRSIAEDPELQELPPV